MAGFDYKKSEASPQPFLFCKAFLTPGSGQSFKVPDGVFLLYIMVFGGGGSGGANNASFRGGSGGGYAGGALAVTPGQLITNITVGAGATTWASSGGSSSVGTLLSATGGSFGGGAPGTGSFGNGLIVAEKYTGGVGGTVSTNYTGYTGGGASGSPFGNGGNGGSNTCPDYSQQLWAFTGGGGWVANGQDIANSSALYRCSDGGGCCLSMPAFGFRVGKPTLAKHFLQYRWNGSADATIVEPATGECGDFGCGGAGATTAEGAYYYNSTPSRKTYGGNGGFGGGGGAGHNMGGMGGVGGGGGASWGQFGYGGSGAVLIFYTPRFV